MKPDADAIKCHKIKATLQGCLYRLLSITTLKLNNSNELYSYKVPWTKNQKNTHRVQTCEAWEKSCGRNKLALINSCSKYSYFNTDFGTFIAETRSRLLTS